MTPITIPIRSLAAEPEESIVYMPMPREITCILDGFESQLAQIVIEVISEQSEDTLRVMVELACDEAWRGVNLN